MSGVGSFLTGFLEKTTEKIDKRTAEADDYFQKQMEIARTRGLENKTRMDQAMSGTMNQAKQLQAAGVPKDLVIAIAKQNPDDIPEYLSNIQKWKMNGINVNEDFFRSIVKVQGEVGSDEDLPTVIRRIYEPLASQAQANPEEFNNDPETGIWAAMMGHNAMDRARDRLGKEQIADGLTAEQLIAYGDNPRLNLDPNVVVSLDATTLGNEMRATEERLNPPREKDNRNSPSTTNVLMKAFEESVAAEKKAWMESTDINAEDVNDNEVWLAEEPKIMRRVAEQMSMNYGPEFVTQIPSISKWLGGSSEEEITSETLPEPVYIPEEPLPVGDTPETEKGSPKGSPSFIDRVRKLVVGKDEPISPIKPKLAPDRPKLTTVDKEEPKKSKVGRLVKDNEDGTSFWVTKTGKLIRVKNSQLPGMGLSEAPS